MTFLSWAAEPEMDERKLMGTKWLAVLSLVRGTRRCFTVLGSGAACMPGNQVAGRAVPGES